MKQMDSGTRALAFWAPGEYWAYQPYAALPCLPVYPASSGTQNVACDLSILSAESAVVWPALGLKQVSSMGAAYQAAIAAYSVPH